jgi:hypothetical protein
LRAAQIARLAPPPEALADSAVQELAGCELDRLDSVTGELNVHHL